MERQNIKESKNDLESFVDALKSLKRSREEITGSYSLQIDDEYVTDLIEAFDLKVNVNCFEKELILRIVNCTNAHQINFGGIDINAKIDPFDLNGQELLGFGRFQENYLATDLTFEKLYFIDLELPEGESILAEVSFDQLRFADLLVFLAQLDVEFRYRNRKIDKRDFQRAIEIAGRREYTDVLHYILGQYID